MGGTSGTSSDTSGIAVSGIDSMSLWIVLIMFWISSCVADLSVIIVDQAQWCLLARILSEGRILSCRNVVLTLLFLLRCLAPLQCVMPVVVVIGLELLGLCLAASLTLISVLVNRCILVAEYFCMPVRQGMGLHDRISLVWSFLF